MVAAVTIFGILGPIRFHPSQYNSVLIVSQQYRPTNRRWPNALPFNASAFHHISRLYSGLNVQIGEGILSLFDTMFYQQRYILPSALNHTFKRGGTTNYPILTVLYMCVYIYIYTYIYILLVWMTCISPLNDVLFTTTTYQMSLNESLPWTKCVCIRRYFWKVWAKRICPRLFSINK